MPPIPSSCGLSFWFHPCSLHSEKLPFWPALFQPLSFSSPPFPPFFPPFMVSSHCPHSSVPAFNPSISVFLTAVPVHMVDAGIQPALLCRNLAWHTPSQCVCVRWLSYLLLGCCCYFFNQWLHFLMLQRSSDHSCCRPSWLPLPTPASRNTWLQTTTTHTAGVCVASLHGRLLPDTLYCTVNRTWHNNVIDRSTSKFFFIFTCFLWTLLHIYVCMSNRFGEC